MGALFTGVVEEISVAGAVVTVVSSQGLTHGVVESSDASGVVFIVNHCALKVLP